MLYVHLYHGRKDPGEKLEDWGLEGPTFGPYENVQITYGSHIKMHTKDDFEDLGWVDDLVFYDGVYYGDMCIYPAPIAKEDTLVEYDATKARKR